MSETCSVILEALYASRTYKTGVISTDDLLARINTVAEETLKEGDKFVKRGTPWDEAYQKNSHFMSSTDVEALFPSLEARSSAEICRKAVVDSDRQIQSLDLEEALLYLTVNERNTWTWMTWTSPGSSSL